METRINEIAAGIYRLSTFVPEIAPPAGFTFNQFLVLGEEPLLFHAGLRRMFPSVRTALACLIPPERLRWITFGHYEADECGAMNEWLAVAPRAEVASRASCRVRPRALPCTRGGRDCRGKSEPFDVPRK
jgi:flavorubredoxin